MKSDVSKLWEQIHSDLFAPTTPDTRPVIVSVGGQPGAGKTRQLSHILNKEYASTNVVRVLGDELRLYHPNYYALLTNPDPQVMPRETAEFSAHMVDKCLAYARKHSYSVAVEGTMRRPEITLGTLKDFHAHGFTTHLVVLAVPESISWQGCVMRYVQPYVHGEAARWAPKAAHDAGYEGTERTLKQAQFDKRISRLTIVTRHGEMLYDTATASNPGALTPLKALEYGRATFNDIDVELWHSNQRFIDSVLHQVPEKIRNEICNGPTLIRPINVLSGVGVRPIIQRSTQVQASLEPHRHHSARSHGHTL